MTGSKISGFMLFMILLSPIAKANFIYTYTGNTFTVTRSSYETVEINGSYEYIEILESFDSLVTATISTPELFTSGTSWNNDMVITVTGTIYNVPNNPEYGLSVVTFPFPEPYFPAYSPQVFGTLDIFSVDSLGLPSDWDIFVRSSYMPPTGREQLVEFNTATNLDSLFGYVETFSDFSGASSSNPGAWSVRMVSEPFAFTFVFIFAIFNILIRYKSLQK